MTLAGLVKGQPTLFAKLVIKVLLLLLPLLLPLLPLLLLQTGG